MRLRVLTIVGVGTLTAVDRVTRRPTVEGAAASALRPAKPIGAGPSSSNRHGKSPIGAGSSQDHASEAERCCLQGVALAFFPQVAGRDRLLKPNDADSNRQATYHDGSPGTWDKLSRAPNRAADVKPGRTGAFVLKRLSNT